MKTTALEVPVEITVSVKPEPVEAIATQVLAYRKALAVGIRDTAEVQLLTLHFQDALLSKFPTGGDVMSLARQLARGA